MGTKVQFREYLEHVQRFLDIDLTDEKELIETIKKYEPSGRVQHSAKGFSLGLAVWPVERIVASLKEIQTTVSECMLHFCEQGIISETDLNKLNAVCHDLKIRYYYDRDVPSHMRLGYHVPDTRIAWDEAKCPHCGETIMLQIFPDPIPIIAYEAIMNLLRLLSRAVYVKRCEKCGVYFIPSKRDQRYHSEKCRTRKEA